MANARQVALRTRLRHFYWLTDCKPMPPETIDTVRRKMALIDPRDTLTEPELDELLSVHYGFALSSDEHGEVRGWVVPELDELRDTALASIGSMRDRMSQLGRASGAKRTRAASAPSTAAPEPDSDGEF